MLSVVDKLIRHVESSQLTFDLGGFLPYNHKEWIQLRMVSCDFLAWSCDFPAKPCDPFARSCELPAWSCEPFESHVILIHPSFMNVTLIFFSSLRQVQLRLGVMSITQGWLPITGPVSPPSTENGTFHCLLQCTNGAHSSCGATASSGPRGRRCGDCRGVPGTPHADPRPAEESTTEHHTRGQRAA